MALSCTEAETSSARKPDRESEGIETGKLGICSLFPPPEYEETDVRSVEEDVPCESATCELANVPPLHVRDHAGLASTEQRDDRPEQRKEIPGNSQPA